MNEIGTDFRAYFEDSDSKRKTPSDAAGTSICAAQLKEPVEECSTLALYTQSPPSAARNMSPTVQSSYYITNSPSSSNRHHIQKQRLESSTPSHRPSSSQSHHPIVNNSSRSGIHRSSRFCKYFDSPWDSRGCCVEYYRGIQNTSPSS
jgi:hypothetical protein